MEKKKKKVRQRVTYYACSEKRSNAEPRMADRQNVDKITESMEFI
jgi:hypothetical protein